MSKEENPSTENNDNQNRYLYLKEIIKAQLVWYLINFLILFFQLYVSFDIPYINNFYIMIFKFIGSSFFISFLLYYTTMVYDLSFQELGISFKNFIENSKLGLQLSFFFLFGIIIIHLSDKNLRVNSIINIHNGNDFRLSIIYFVILFICYLIPAFSKELFYRGFVYYHFKKEYGIIIGFMLNTLYYALSYLDLRLITIAIHLLMAILTTYLYEKTDSLVTSVIFQATYQASLSLYLFSFDKWPF
ncbi:hypothetical protein BX659_12180 [Orenia metallireducens]|jgi:hypothetical protein|uniref:CAAX prenyl protease 2/Lysostaphin resistance protein A-like domain-containing protein n=1 Tax=Orenia metallireducens TaxID=1413210 RepID=A0A285H7K7_9FIRM|nr:CPBP family intramembrane glutamic endopeptidase [Orenia metallireducens]PRX26243.1 hypothetical protein BX659_12180 [Orenia metallireducens]SNY31677.1 hypothetical protein SAMN06265827_11542 [Orenia metallireducens]